MVNHSTTFLDKQTYTDKDTEHLTLH